MLIQSRIRHRAARKESLRGFLAGGVGIAGILCGAMLMPAPVSAQSVIQFTGSTSILPIVTDAANEFRKKHGTWSRVNPELSADDIVIYTSGGGSSTGVRAAIDRSAHVGMANREMRPQEKERLGEHELHVIGIDGIAIAAHRDNPLFGVTKDLSGEQIAQIFSGEIGRYSDFNKSLPDREIVLLIRDASGGNTQIMQSMIMNKRTFSAGALQLPSTGTQLRRLETNANAIGYISSGVIWRSQVLEPFAVDGVMPTQEKLVDGSYRLQRRMLLIVPGKSPPHVKAFIDFLLSPEGQAIVERHDYVPASDPKVAS